MESLDTGEAGISHKTIELERSVNTRKTGGDWPTENKKTHFHSRQLEMSFHNKNQNNKWIYSGRKIKNLIVLHILLKHVAYPPSKNKAYGFVPGFSDLNTIRFAGCCQIQKRVFKLFRRCLIEQYSV